MANKITFDDKVGLEARAVHINQVWDADINEIKSKHNLNDDRITQNESDIGTNKTATENNATAILSNETQIELNAITAVLAL